MSRYVHEFRDISGDALPPRGMDPNYRGRYRGMRMGAEEGQGAYGWYRWRHARELGRGGGYDRGYGPARFYDWEMRGGGGVRDPRYDREFIRGFNADSQMFRDYTHRGPGRGGYFERGPYGPGRGSR